MGEGQGKVAPGQGEDMPPPAAAAEGGPSPSAKRVKDRGEGGSGKKPARYHKW